jgi:serine/threonine protein kinase
MGSTLRKIYTRVIGCIFRTSSSYELLATEYASSFEMHTVLNEPTAGDSNSSSNGTNGTAGDVDASWHVDECDVVKVKQLGNGAYGSVWEAKLISDDRRVAVKFLFAGLVDDDGDPIDPNAIKDFQKECAALQRVDSPHLLKFFGFGTTADGSGFIVTELMRGGSLEDVLHNPERDLPWPTRAKIGLQVALGMEHLHQKHMLHRDLKFANVLLDEELRAKVCDFGLTRVARPARQHVLYSPFTGVTRQLPEVDGIDINYNGQPVVPSIAHTSASILDARGTMTKAVGTLRWMAPEVFRGDQTYTRAVDV